AAPPPTPELVPEQIGGEERDQGPREHRRERKPSGARENAGSEQDRRSGQRQARTARQDEAQHDPDALTCVHVLHETFDSAAALRMLSTSIYRERGQRLPETRAAEDVLLPFRAARVGPPPAEAR